MEEKQKKKKKLCVCNFFPRVPSLLFSLSLSPSLYPLSLYPLSLPPLSPLSLSLAVCRRSPLRSPRLPSRAAAQHRRQHGRCGCAGRKAHARSHAIAHTQDHRASGGCERERRSERRRKDGERAKELQARRSLPPPLSLSLSLQRSARVFRPLCTCMQACAALLRPCCRAAAEIRKTVACLTTPAIRVDCGRGGRGPQRSRLKQTAALTRGFAGIERGRGRAGRRHTRKKTRVTQATASCFHEEEGRTTLSHSSLLPSLPRSRPCLAVDTRHRARFTALWQRARFRRQTNGRRRTAGRTSGRKILHPGQRNFSAAPAPRLCPPSSLCCACNTCSLSRGRGRAGPSRSPLRRSRGGGPCALLPGRCSPTPVSLQPCCLPTPRTSVPWHC